MGIKGTAIKTGLRTAKAAPAKGKLAKRGLKIGKHKAERSSAGTAVLYGQALVGNEQARRDLKEAFASARKAYGRSSDRRGRPDIAALFEDRKARREAGNAVTSLKSALNVAGRKRRKPRSAKAPVIAVVAVAGAGTAVALNENLRSKLTAPFGGGDAEDGAATTGAANTYAEA